MPNVPSSDEWTRGFGPLPGRRCRQGPGGSWYLCWIISLNEGGGWLTPSAADETGPRFLPLGSGFGGEGEVPGVTRDLSGRGGGLDRDACLFGSRVGGRLPRGLRRVGAEVRQRQGDGPHVVDPQQNLQGADFLESLVGQSVTGPLDLLYTGREGADPTSCRQREMLISLATMLVLAGRCWSSLCPQPLLVKLG